MPLLWLLIGVLSCSTSVIWVKFSTVDPVLLTGMRLAIAALLLSPFAWRDWRKHRAEMSWSHLRDSAIPGVVLAAHFSLWMIAARMTLASHGVLIVNLTPLVTPFLLAITVGERINRRELLATLLAGVGLGVLFASDYRLSAEHFRGDLLCLCAMGLLALYLVLGRKFRHHPTNLLYVAPMYGVASLAAFATAPWLADPAPIDWRAETPWILLIVLLPTILGHSLLNQSMRHFRGQVVSLVNMLQFVSAGLLAWWTLGEQPSSEFYFAALLIVAAGVIVVRPPGKPDGPPGEAPIAD